MLLLWEVSTCGLGCGGRGTWAASYLAGLISSVEFQMTNDFILDWEKKKYKHTHTPGPMPPPAV